MIQLTRGGVLCPGSEETLQELQSEFAERHCVRLRQFFEPSLLEQVQRYLERTEFYNRTHDDDIRVELCMANNHLAGLLYLLINSQKLFQALEHLTGCRRIEQFQGRIYRMLPGSGHYDSWHSDMGEDERILGISVNLSTEIYSGGIFQLRPKGEAIRTEVANTGFGDAILFRLAPNLFHRVTPVDGTAAKTAFAGWFMPRPPRHPLVRAGAQGSLAEFPETGPVRR